MAEDIGIKFELLMLTGRRQFMGVKIILTKIK
jgi:hypothetical protein